MRYQHLCVDNSKENRHFNLFPCPVTGAIEEGEVPEAAAHRKTYKETGYTTTLTTLGQYIVGTQINGVCFLYYADVTGVEPSTALQDDTFLESVAYNQWHSLEHLKRFDYAACQLGDYQLKAHLISSHRLNDFALFLPSYEQD